MPDILKTTLGSLALPNPFILASGPPTASGEMIRRAFQAGWGGAVIKTIHPDGMEIQDLSPRFAAWTGTKGELFGFENVELLSKKTVSYWENEIRSLKQDFPANLLVASIMGDTDFSTWQNLAIRVGDAGCDAIELNVSCPHGMPEAGLGAAIGQNPDLIRKLTKMVSAVASVPVFVKLTPNITDIGTSALSAEEGGADGVSAINTIQCILGIDIDSFEPLPSTGGKGTSGGYSGPAIKPIGLKMVSDISQAVSLPIMGIGGISKWQDAVEYILLGASAVQICTAVMWNGYEIIRAMKTGMENYLIQNGFNSPDEIRGTILGKMQPHHTISRSIRIEPAISESQVCLQCGKCVTACRDGGYDALILTPKGPVVERTRCDGCGLCLLVCGSKALTSMIRSG